ncbi:hypothetical protein U1Q18_048537 [Sarracenia purpurea var. burkii]
MDSIYFFIGYDKVNQPAPSKINHQHIIIPTIESLFLPSRISLIILLTVMISATIGALVHKSNTKPPEYPSLSTKSAESIRSICSVTQFPDTCFASISSLTNSSRCSLFKGDPELIFSLSLQVAINELLNLSSMPKTMIYKSNDPRTESALKDCVDLLGNALSQIGKSATAMVVGPGEKMLTEEKIGDLKTWINAAMTDQETCLDGLEEMGSTVVDEARLKVQRSKEYMSNSLAILSNIQTVLQKFHLTMHS